jgi:hypothetical protein
MNRNGERRDSGADPVSSARSKKAGCGARGWLPGRADAPMSASGERPDGCSTGPMTSADATKSSGSMKSAETKKADDGARGWLPGRADAPMSACAKRPNRQTEVIYI